MELHDGIFCLAILTSCYSVSGLDNYKEVDLPELPFDMVNPWAKKFSDKIVTLTKNFTAFEDLFKKFSRNGGRLDVDGREIVNDIASKIETLLSNRVEAVKKLVYKAEEIYENYTFDEFLDVDYLNSKKLLSDETAYILSNSSSSSSSSDSSSSSSGGSDNVVEMSMNFQSIRLDPSSKFNSQPVNNETSTVQVATNVFDGSATIINGAYWSNKLDETFKSNYLEYPSITWQYFCSSDGYFRIFPGMKWPRDNEESGVDMFDCRLRSWYLQAATCRKTVIILMDTSGSMKGLRMKIARSTVHQILDTLTDDDYFNIIKFSDDIEYLDDCFNFTLVPANTNNKARLRELIDMEIETKEKANFERALIEAFRLSDYFVYSGATASYQLIDDLQRSKEFRLILEKNLSLGEDLRVKGENTAFKDDIQRRTGSGKRLCNKAILVVTDGIPENYAWIFNTYNWPDKRTRVFTYLIGREVKDEREVKWMACANRGYYSHISTLSDVRENVQNYIKVLSRPLVISRDHDTIWSSVYLDHFSSLQIDKGLRFMTSVAVPVFDTSNGTFADGNLLGVMGTDVPIQSMIDLAPPHRLGPNAFAFLVNHNGYVMAHPDFRPYQINKDTDELVMNPNYSNMDLSDVMLPTNKEKLKWIKNSMLTSYGDSETIELLIHYDNMKRMVKRNYSVFYRKIQNSNFSIGIALPSTSLLDVDAVPFTNYDLKTFLNSSNFELAPWPYCDGMDANMTSREKIAEILEKSKGGRLVTSKICDTTLLDQLTHDTQMTSNIEQKWMDMAKQFPSSYGVELVFIGTKGGLTKYMKAQNLTDKNFIKHSKNTVKADYYRRAVEGAEKMDKQPEYNVTFSIPLKEDMDLNKTMVTASIPIVIRAGAYVKGVRAVVGLQLKYENFAKLFLESVSTCAIDAYPCPTRLSCKDDTFSCFLVDNHGYVLASKTPESDVGKFFGEVDGQVMTYLVMFHNLFVGYNFTDHQSICDIKSSDRKKNSASFILNPLKALFNAVLWTITEVALFLTEFSWRSLWTTSYDGVKAQYAECEFQKLKDYEDLDLEIDEQDVFNQLKSFCYRAQLMHKDEVVGHRSCDKSFTLYRSNLNAFQNNDRETVQGAISNCQMCTKWKMCGPEDEDCEESYCVEYARFCEKQYAASWVKDTNLIFIMVSKNCDCLDEMPFNLKPKEVNYTYEETCSKLKQATLKGREGHCHDFSDIEDESKCGVGGVAVSILLLLLSLVASWLSSQDINCFIIL